MLRRKENKIMRKESSEFSLEEMKELWKRFLKQLDSNYHFTQLYEGVGLNDFNVSTEPAVYSSQRDYTWWNLHKIYPYRSGIHIESIGFYTKKPKEFTLTDPNDIDSIIERMLY